MTRMERLRVLVVDDDPNMIDVLELGLGAKYEVYGAKSGKEALVMIKTHKPHAVLTDLYMSGMSGFELAREISGMPPKLRPTVRVMSGERGEYQVARAQEVNAEFIAKPFTIPQIRAILDEDISRRLDATTAGQNVAEKVYS